MLSELVSRAVVAAALLALVLRFGPVGAAHTLPRATPAPRTYRRTWGAVGTLGRRCWGIRLQVVLL
jgi:hypothetical protein